MSVLIDQLPVILQGFWMTIRLTAFAALIALVLGTVLAAMRVSPVPPLRWARHRRTSTSSATPR